MPIRHIKSILKLCSLLGISGVACIPFPHTEVVTPNISGVLNLAKGDLKQDEVPEFAKEVRLGLSATMDCSSIVQESMTNEIGVFHFKELRQFVYTIQMEHYYHWSICYQQEGVYQPLSQHYQRGYPPNTLNMICSLSQHCIVKEDR